MSEQSSKTVSFGTISAKQKERNREVLCPCGCGVPVSHPVERQNGRLVVLPIPRESLRLLETVHHPKTRLDAHSGHK